MQQHAQKDADPLAGMPPVPPKATHSPAERPAYDAASRVPQVDASKIGALSNKSESHRLETDLRSASAHRHSDCTCFGKRWSIHTPGPEFTCGRCFIVAQKALGHGQSTMQR